MNISFTKKDDLNATISLSVSPADYEAKVNESLKDYRRKAQIKGFRPGQAPMSMIQRMVGRDIKIHEIDKLVSETLTKYIGTEKIEFLVQPLPSDSQEPVDLDKAGDHEFIFDLALRPTIDFAFNKTVELPYYKIQVSDEMIEKEVERFKNKVGKTEPVAVASVDSFLKVELVQVNEDGSEKELPIANYNATMSVSVIKDEEIKQKFIGLTEETELVIDLKKAFPNDTELASLMDIPKEEVAQTEPFFKVSIKEITEYKPGELTDENLKKFYPDGTVTNETELRAKIKEEIEAFFVQESDYRLSVDARDYMKTKSNFAMPNDFLKRYLVATSKDGKIDAQTIENEYDAFAEGFRMQLMLDKLAREYGVTVSEEDVRAVSLAALSRQFRQYGLTLEMLGDRVNEFVNSDLKDSKKREQYASQVVEDRVFLQVKELVTLKEKSVSEEDFKKLFEEEVAE